MFLLKTIRAENAAKILAGYCDKQTDCRKCRFVGESGECILRDTIPLNWKEALKDEKS